MRKEITKKHETRSKRAMRVRKNLRGTASKPRLCVMKSNKHICVQLIDDESGKTLGSSGTCSKEFKSSEFSKKNKASAAKLGSSIAKIAQEQNISEVIFDRGPFKYHGILAALADSAREAGLQF